MMSSYAPLSLTMWLLWQSVLSLLRCSLVHVVCSSGRSVMTSWGRVLGQPQGNAAWSHTGHWGPVARRLWVKAEQFKHSRSYIQSSLGYSNHQKQERSITTPETCYITQQFTEQAVWTAWKQPLGQPQPTTQPTKMSLYVSSLEKKTAWVKKLLTQATRPWLDEFQQHYNTRPTSRVFSFDPIFLKISASMSWVVRERRFDFAVWNEVTLPQESWMLIRDRILLLNSQDCIVLNFHALFCQNICCCILWWMPTWATHSCYKPLVTCSVSMKKAAMKYANMDILVWWVSSAQWIITAKEEISDM